MADIVFGIAGGIILLVIFAALILIMALATLWIDDKERKQFRMEQEDREQEKYLAEYFRKKEEKRRAREVRKELRRKKLRRWIHGKKRN
ncbi:MAG TPA: hypothetical protein H9765_04545 [Candidatus Mediterraneibacter intestinigallinarum]|nr:hypothetical protein [Candidatus Mediterraneibacter intestinigallinarum]